MKKRLVVCLLVTLVAVFGVLAVASFADPGLNNVQPHRHWINGVQVGPDVCDNPNLQQAFNQFHNNLHIATGSSIGPAAPGLHNGQGGEITATGC